MSGKAYSMKEMKSIVEYLTEHNAYGEIKGRKMWMDFANSKITNRTWQSLKETFLKRILPDIHNPYYKLSLDQIRSFRQGQDMTNKDNMKLEILNISDSSHSDVNGLKDGELSTTSNKNEENQSSGEDIKRAKSNNVRSSTETLIIDTCYETAEDVRRDLESPGNDKNEKPRNKGNKEDSRLPTKSLRDCITYSEPLTPMLQEVLDDFATESEESDQEPKMHIVEDIATEPDKVQQSSNSTSTDKAKKSNEECNIFQNIVTNNKENSTISSKYKSSQHNKDQNDTSESNGANKCTEQLTPSKFIDEVNRSLPEMSVTKNGDNRTEKRDHDITTEPPQDVDGNSEINSREIPKTQENTINTGKFTENAQNYSNTTFDSVLPNNQEALDNELYNGKPHQDLSRTRKSNSPKVNNKRHGSISETESVKNKKILTKCNTKQPAHSHIDISLKTNIIGHDENDSVKVHSNTIHEKHADNGQDMQISNKSKINLNENKTNSTEKIPKSSKKVIESRSPSEELLSKNNDKIDSSVSTSPCLKSVTLCTEQMSSTKYDNSKSSDNANTSTKKNSEHKTNKETNISKVIILKSHSESDSVEKSPISLIKSQRNRALADMFGYPTGRVSTKRKRSLSSLRKSAAHCSRNANTSSGSSEWTSEDESEYVVPLRGRKSRYTKKYLKPRSARIVSLQEEGGLFVAHRQKIYPILKDGKNIKNFTLYLPESDQEEPESYWKLKYMEEKKRNAELIKLFNQPKSDNNQLIEPSITAAPQANSTQSLVPIPEPQRLSKDSSTTCIDTVTSAYKDTTEAIKDKTVKVKYSKNNEEVHLEGHWPHVHPILEQVMQIFHKESEPRFTEIKPALEVPATHTESISGKSTPIEMLTPDEVVHEKVNLIEYEIFKKIEDSVKTEQNENNEDIPQDCHVNVRKRGKSKTRISTTTLETPNSPSKKLKISDENEKQETQKKTSEKRLTEDENNSAPPRNSSVPRKPRTPRKTVNENTTSNQINTRSAASKQLDTGKEQDDSEIRYKFPSPTPEKSSRKELSLKKSKQQKIGKNYSLTLNKIVSDESSLNSVENTQGYQDSDVSPINLCRRKKRKTSLPTFSSNRRNRFQRNILRKSHSYFDDSSNDSCSAPFDVPKQSITFHNSSLNSEAYTSDSYQLLMPGRRKYFEKLEKIVETCPLDQTYVCFANINTLSPRSNRTNEDNVSNSIHGNSSNFSLPLSPELSIVENISIDKSRINNTEICTALNNFQDITPEEENNNKYVISEIDVTMPLMGQKCDLQKKHNVSGSDLSIETNAIRLNIDRKSVVSESLLDKMSTVNIEDSSSSDSLNQKLCELLLESAKKMSKEVRKIVKENVQIVDDKASKTTNNKEKSKKRSSTPHKKLKTQKSHVSDIEPRIEEEHTEACILKDKLHIPSINIVSITENNEVEDLNNTSPVTTVKFKNRKKKDIIKVKILKPKGKKKIKERKLSVHTDSGMNAYNKESGVFFQNFNDSIDLIHNHSENCLHANECIHNDSVEIIDTNSVVSINSNTVELKESNNDSAMSKTRDETPDQFFNDAQISKSLCMKRIEAENNSNVTCSAFHTPQSSVNSLITEDLSDNTTPSDYQTSKWYLLSEDETNVPYADLNKIFPLTCAVPNLSTITEISKDTDENSQRKMNVDNHTRNDLGSLSLLDPKA